MSKTVAEAVAELNALSIAEARELLSQYDNTRGNGDGRYRCVSCPVAQHLEAQSNTPVWVSPDGEVRNIGADGIGTFTDHIVVLSDNIVALIEEFDCEAYTGQKAA